MNNKVKIGIIISVILLLGVAGFSWYVGKQKNNKFPTEVEKNLTSENRKIFEDRVVDQRKKISESKTDDEKFLWEIQLGYNLQSLGHLGQAIDIFNEAITLRPNNPQGYAGLFEVENERGNYDGAKQNILIAIDKNPESVNLWKKYIQLLTDRFNLSNDALNLVYIDALNKTSNRIDIITFYAQFLEKSGDVPKAIEYWQKAIAGDSANKAIYQAEIDRIQKLIK